MSSNSPTSGGGEIGPILILLMPSFGRPYVWGLLLGASFFMCTLSSSPRNRGRVIRWLGSLGQSGSSREQEAAAVAALM